MNILTAIKHLWRLMNDQCPECSYFFKRIDDIYVDSHINGKLVCRQCGWRMKL
jgi:hypothetical protein